MLRRWARGIAVVPFAFLVTPAQGELPPVRQVADLRTVPFDRTISTAVGAISSVGGRAVALVSAPDDPVLLWSSDGSVAGSEFLLGSCPLDTVPGPGQLLDGRFWFSFCGLHVTDGTREGTHALGLSAAAPSLLGPIGDSHRVLVAGSHPYLGAGLFTTAGQAGDLETLALGSFEPVLGSDSAPLQARLADGRLAFAVGVPGGREVWVTDGSPQGTFAIRAVADIRGLYAAGDQLLVTARRQELTLLFGLAPTRNGRFEELASNVRGVVAGRTRAYCFTRDETGTTLQSTDGRSLRVVRALDYGGADVGLVGLAAEDRLYFLGPDGFWTSDGTAAGTRSLSVVSASPTDLALQVVMAPLAGGRVLFAGGLGGTDMGQWTFDTAGNVQEIRRCRGAGSCADPVRRLQVTPSHVVLEEVLGDDSHAIWTDGTRAGTRDAGILSSAGGLVVGAGLDDGTVIGGATAGPGPRLISVATGRGPRFLLAGEVTLADSGSRPTALTTVEERTYFVASADQDPVAWSTDGHRTRLEPFWAAGSELQSLFFGSGGTVVAGVSTPDGRTFWSPEGLFSGPPLSSFVASLWPLGDGQRFVFSSGTALLRGDSATRSYQPLVELSTDDRIHEPTPLVRLGPDFYTFDNRYQRIPGGQRWVETALWQTDGSASGTRPVSLSPEALLATREPLAFGDDLLAFQPRNLRRIPLDGRPPIDLEATSAGLPSLFRTSLVLSGSRAFYFAYDVSTNTRHELWTTDGTPGGTRRLSTPLRFVPVNLALVPFRHGVAFVARDGVGGEELWWSDGTSPGTRRLADLYPGSTGSWPRDLQVIGDRLYFSATDGLHGRELWMTDGRTTWRLTDLAPGVRSSNPSSFAGLGEEVLFAADQGDVNREVWAVSAAATGEPATAGEPEPPGPWRTAAALPGFRFKAFVANGDQWLETSIESACLAETVCLSGAVPGRPEVFLRVVGPKPNGFLWPTLVKFSTSAVEVWIQQEATGLVRHYWLDPAQPGFDELAALFDRGGFLPAGAAPARPSVRGGTEPPAGAPWLTSPQLPGFRVAVAITGPDGPIPTRGESDCIAETLCVSGALPGRAEVFVRVVGPKPNGRLWPTLVRFTTSPVEIWIEQLSRHEVRHYTLVPPDPGLDLLTGLFDRQGFVP